MAFEPNNVYEILKAVFEENGLNLAFPPSNEYEVLKAVYDNTNQALRVTLQGSGTDDDFVLFAESLIEGDNISFDINTTAHTVTISVTGLTEVQTVTYAELQALVTASSLEVGKRYLITDFAQSYNIFDGGTMAIQEEKIGALEPLILKAIATNKFDKVAISPLRPNDIIHYSFNILDIRDIGFGNGVDTVNANFKGQIYYRKDTVQNVETHYNFVPTYGVQFRRWAVDAVAFDNGVAYVARDVCKASDGKIYKCITATTGEGDPTVNTADWILWLDITEDAFVSWTADKTKFNIGDITTDGLIINNVTAGVDYDDFYTFGDYYKWVKDVSLGGINLDLQIANYGSATILLSQKVFKTTDSLYTCYSIKFGDNNLPMTFGNNNSSMTFGNGNNSMTFGNKNSSMTFRNNNSSMIFGGGNYSMTFGNYNSSMTFGNYNSSMVFGDSNYLMTFGNNNYIMTFGNSNRSMTFGDSNRSMTFGDNNHSMTFGDNNYSMTFGNINYSMIFGNDNLSMTFGDGNYSMVFGNENSMIFGNDNYSMTFGDNNYAMTFGIYNSSMTFGDSNLSMTFGNDNLSMTFGNNNSMTFGNNNSSMTFGNKNSMTFGNYTNPENKIITFGDYIKMCIFEDRCFRGLAADLDLSAATHIRGEYNTTIYQDAVDGVKLSYMTGGELTIAAVTA